MILSTNKWSDIWKGIQENQLEEDSELRKMVGDFPNLGLQTLTKGKLIVKNGGNIMIPKDARASILNELHITHLGPEMMNNIFHGGFFWNRINKDVEKIQNMTFDGRRHLMEANLWWNMTFEGQQSFRKEDI